MDLSALQQVLASGVAGTLLGVVVAFFLAASRAQSERRLKLTLELYSEFHAPAFNHIRIDAYEALEASKRAVPGAYLAVTKEEKVAISSVVHFFEKLGLLWRAGAVNPALLRSFFSQYARFWRPLLVEAEGGAGLDDPEWGRTLRVIDDLFRRLAPPERAGSAHPRP